MKPCKYCGVDLNWSKDGEKWIAIEAVGGKPHDCPKKPQRSAGGGGFSRKLTVRVSVERVFDLDGVETLRLGLDKEIYAEGADIQEVFKQLEAELIRYKDRRVQA